MFISAWMAMLSTAWYARLLSANQASHADRLAAPPPPPEVAHTDWGRPRATAML